MPQSDYISLKIGDVEIQSNDPSELPVSISYKLEDRENFQEKKSGEALEVTVPATLINSTAANTCQNPSIEDLTDGEVLRKFQPAVITAGGYDLLVGKALLKRARHRDIPTSFTWNIFGDNANWIIDLKEVTLYDLLKHINFIFSKTNIENSWAFNGTNEALPYVFAPVRYRAPFGGSSIVDDELVTVDDNVVPEYMRPALSKYWLIYWAFKSVGYQVVSTFFDTNYYRRMVLPWSWGNFLSSEGTRLDIHKFRAKSTRTFTYDSPNGGHDFIWNLDVSNDSTEGMFDNNGTPGDYTYNAAQGEMKWTYNTPHFGNLDVTFSIDVYYELSASGNSSAILYLQWRKNGGAIIDSGYGPFSVKGNKIAERQSSGVGGTNAGISSTFFTTNINPGDEITCKVHLHTFESKVGHANAVASVQQIQIDYFKIPLGGTLDFENFTGFKKHKFIDLLRGEVDLHDLQFHTDPISKKVYIEPMHDYSLVHDQTVKNEGFFKRDFIDWSGKEDYSKEWDMELHSDGERERILRFKEDNNDGILKLVQDRHGILLGSGKYVLPERFKAGKPEIENRYYGPTMHYDADQFKTLGTGTNEGLSPQFICMIPENVSNTSNSESGNTFAPKSAWYKGLITGVGAWKWDGTVRQDLPYMFAVNYKPGGENDPVLSYSDERIGDVTAVGLLRRFFLQRFAIERNGQWYTTYQRLNNADVSNQSHREFKAFGGHKWELISINNYLPLKSEATQCFLRKWVPIMEADRDAVFPSEASIQDDDITANPLDRKYNQLKSLTSDIPV